MPVPTHVALLRGVNVGGKNRVAMANLRVVVESLGHTEVSTYIQSGNVVFTPAETPCDPAVVASSLENRIADRLRIRPSVVVLTRDDLALVVERNPFTEESDPKRVHAIFRATESGLADVQRVEAAVSRAREKGGRDEARIIGRVLYLLTPDGFGRSKLAELLTRRDPGAVDGGGTARNWATVTRLLALLEERD